MILANLKMSLRNRTALFWNLLFPALFIVIFGLVFGNTGGVTFSVGIVGPPSDYQNRVVAVMAGSDAFAVTRGAEGEELMALREGERDVVLIFAPLAADNPGAVPTVTLYYDQTNRSTAQIALGAVRQVLTAVAGDPAESDNVIVRPVTTQEVSFIDFFVPGVLAMSIMNSGIIGLSTSFVTYRERGILRRIKVTPFPLSSFVLAKVLAQMIQIVLQALILVGLGLMLFGLNVRGNPVLILGIVIAGSLAFLAIGFAISSVARNAEIAASYANLITFPMLFLSGVFFPVDSVPDWLQPLLKVLPLAYLVDALRQLMTLGRGLPAIWTDLAVLAATFAVGIIFAVRFFRWDATTT
jgi:ABC-2 type transport system permease protein